MGASTMSRGLHIIIALLGTISLLTSPVDAFSTPHLSAATFARTAHSSLNRCVVPVIHNTPSLLFRSKAFPIKPRNSIMQLRAKAATDAAPTKVTPVTILSGFLGTGKTTALKHILENKEGLRVGVIVNDVAEVNIDAKLVSGYDAISGTSTIELQNGCACCSVSDELFNSVQNLLDLGKERGKPFDHIVIELSGVAEPTLVKDNFEQARREGLPAALSTRISHVVTVVDTSEFVDLWTTDEKIGERQDLAGDAVDDCANRRSVVELLAEQIEAADRIILNKIDLATSLQLRNAQDVVKGLAAKAEVRVAEHGKVPIDFYFSESGAQLIKKPQSDHDRDHDHEGHAHTEACHDPECHDESHGHSHAHVHDHDEACHDAKCTDESHGHSHSHAHSHEEDCHDAACTNEAHGHTHGGQKKDTTAKTRFGIDSFVYRARRPFAAERLIGVIKNWPIPHKNLDQYIEILTTGETKDFEKVGVVSKSPLTRVIRSKGFAWLDSSPCQSLYWSHAGRHFSLDNAGKWWAEASPDTLTTLSKTMPAEYERMMKDEWEGEFGDRRQEIVFIGAGMDSKEIQTVLDGCLLDDSELKEFKEELAQIIEVQARLRFKEGDRVVCRCDKWEKGTIIKVGYREPQWPLDQPDAPYQVRLDNGSLIWVPEDEDVYIMPLDK